MDVMTRREFLKISGLFTGTFVIGSPLLLSACTSHAAPLLDQDSYFIQNDTVTIVLDKAPQLAQIGGSGATVCTGNGIPLIIARTALDQFAVAFNQCPHNSKQMHYDHKAGLFICASGKSKFGLDGSIVKSPVDNPLPIYRWYYDRNRLVIHTHAQIN